MTLPADRTIEDKEDWAFAGNHNERETILQNGAEAVLLANMFKNTEAWDVTKELSRVKAERLQKDADQAATELKVKKIEEEKAKASVMAASKAGTKCSPQKFMTTPPNKRQRKFR